mmetsp:Transcript_19775/g.61352  ORF Transcript_19775/g.61352 Transcript_19775/m.61352 type:complete len:223 (-) Transcript_19775:36-704(-)
MDQRESAPRACQPRKTLACKHGSAREGLPEAAQGGADHHLQGEQEQGAAGQGGDALPQERWPWLQDAQGSDRGQLCGQEVPLHGRRVHPRPHPHGPGAQGQDEPHHHRAPQLPALRAQVPALREAPQERGRAPEPLLPRARGRFGGDWPVPPAVEDGALQRAQGHPRRRRQEGLRRLSADGHSLSGRPRRGVGTGGGEKPQQQGSGLCALASLPFGAGRVLV